jgi:O-antigen/teichoic acid export membrane protein
MRGIQSFNSTEYQKIKNLESNVKVSNHQELGKVIRTGILFSAISSLFTFGLSAIYLIYITRYILPSEWGILALASALAAFVTVLGDLGISSELVQRKECTSNVLSTAFFLNLVSSISIFFVLLSIAYVSANVLSQHLVFWIIAFTGLSVVVDSLSIVPRVILTRRLEFKRLYTSDNIAYAVSIFLTIYFLVSGLGIWGIIYGKIAYSIVKVFLLWLMKPVKLCPVFNISDVREILKYGLHLTLSEYLVRYFYDLSKMILGAFESTDVLGYYAFAFRISRIPNDLLSSIIGPATFPVYSRIKADKEEFLSYLKKQLRLYYAIEVPFCLVISGLSYPIVRYLFTPEWLPSVPLIVALLVMMASYPAGVFIFHIAKSVGMTSYLTKMTAHFSLAFIISGPILTYFFGIAGFLFSLWIRHAIGMFYGWRLVKNITGTSIFSGYFQPFIASLTGGIIAFALSSFITNLISLGLAALFLILIYASILSLIGGKELIFELFHYMQSLVYGIFNRE